MKTNNNISGLSLYVHIPFCVKKCIYCDFNSYAGKLGLSDAYIDSLLKELALYEAKLQGKKINTIFIGGGTPTILNEKLLDKLLKGLSKYSDSAYEYTIESNPGTLTLDKLNIMKSYKINRLSIGLQAVQNTLLKTLGRIHSFEDFLRSFELARKAGFNNINIDLMFGLPGQTPDDWHKTLKEVVSLRPEHISAYSLIVDENTEIFNLIKNKRMSLPDENTERNMYKDAIGFLNASGYRQYEISNFALPGYECTHNIAYWKEKEYIALGAGASSFFQNIRYKNEESIEAYIKRIKKSEIPVSEFDYIDKNSMIREAIILGLRMNEGIDLCSFKNQYGFDINLSFGDIISKYASMGLMDNSNGRIKLTKRGIDISNTIFLDFI